MIHAGELHRRRADTILFVNGVPLVLAEFKEPNRPVKAAFDENLSDYRDTIPQLFEEAKKAGVSGFVPRVLRYTHDHDRA